MMITITPLLHHVGKDGHYLATELSNVMQQAFAPMVSVFCGDIIDAPLHSAVLIPPDRMLLLFVINVSLKVVGRF